METALSSTGTKWATGRPLYPGDIGRNFGAYWPLPDYKKDYWLLQALFAEKLVYSSSEAGAGYDNQMFRYGAASSGWVVSRLLRQFPEQVLERSLRYGVEGDEKFFSTRRAVDFIEQHKILADAVLLNQRNDRDSTLLLGEKAQNRYVISPAFAEAGPRGWSSLHAASKNTGFQDSTWEIHYWLLRCLFPDVTTGILEADHAWSNNAHLEEAQGKAVEYGMAVPLTLRRGRSFDFVDSDLKPVPVYDQALGIAQHLVFEVLNPIHHRGGKYQVRSENAAAHLLVMFMYDDFFLSNRPASETGMEKQWAGNIVLQHYNSPQEMEKYARLKEVMLPFLAEHCNWPTLHRFFEYDPHMQEYWEDKVLRSGKPLLTNEKIIAEVMSETPIGGLRNKELVKFLEEGSAPSTAKYQFNITGKPDMPAGSIPDPQARKWDNKIFGNWLWQRMGDDDPDHWTSDQNAAWVALQAFLEKGSRPFKNPNRLLYLDDPFGGLRASSFLEEHNIDHPEEHLSGAFSAQASGKTKYWIRYGEEQAADFRDWIRALNGDKNFKKWREKEKVGNIDSLSAIARALDYTGRREAFDTEWHKALGAKGPMHMSGLAMQWVAEKIIGMQDQGVILPAGHTTDLQCWLLGQSLTAAVGKTPRTYSGGKYKQKIFMDFDYIKPATHKYEGEPVQMDLADIIIHLGSQLKAELEKPNPSKRTGLITTMIRALDIYERRMDPMRRNQVIEQEPHSGVCSEDSIIDFDQVDKSLFAFYSEDQGIFDFADDEAPIERIKDGQYDKYFNSPEYLAFKQREKDKPSDYYARALTGTDGQVDMVKKAALAKMFWAWMCAEAVELAPAQPGKAAKYAPVAGHLRVRGAPFIDRQFLLDVNSENKKAHDWFHTLNRHERSNIFWQGTKRVEHRTAAVR